MKKFGHWMPCHTWVGSTICILYLAMIGRLAKFGLLTFGERYLDDKIFGR